MKQPKRGAPVKPPEVRRSVLLPIRMSEAEKAEIEAAAAGNTSGWARDVLLKAARKASRSKAL